LADGEGEGEGRIILKWSLVSSVVRTGDGWN